MISSAGAAWCAAGVSAAAGGWRAAASVPRGDWRRARRLARVGFGAQERAAAVYAAACAVQRILMTNTTAEAQEVRLQARKQVKSCKSRAVLVSY